MVVHMPLVDSPSSKRILGALAAVLGTLSCGACDRREKMPQSAQSSIATAIKTLQAEGVSVREFKFNGPNLVVLVTDTQRAEFQHDLERTVGLVQQHFDIDLFGLEGFESGPVSFGPRTDLDLEVNTILAREPSRRVSQTEAKELGFGSIEQFTLPELSRGFANGSEVLFVGLEGPAFPQTDRALVVLVRERLSEAQDYLNRNGFLVVGVENRLFDFFHEVENAQEHLSTRYPSFTGLDFNQLTLLQPEGDTRMYPGLVKGTRSEMLDDALRSVELFEEQHCGGPRSAQAAESIERQMRVLSITKAGMIFGLTHSVDTGPTALSIQQHLDQLNVSYVVVDSVRVQVKRENGRVQFVLPQSQAEVEGPKNGTGAGAPG